MGVTDVGQPRALPSPRAPPARAGSGELRVGVTDIEPPARPRRGEASWAPAAGAAVGGYARARLSPPSAAPLFEGSEDGERARFERARAEPSGAKGIRTGARTPAPRGPAAAVVLTSRGPLLRAP